MSTKNVIYNRIQLAIAVIGTDKTDTTLGYVSEADWPARWARVKKAIYKGTSCGAYIEPILDCTEGLGVAVGSIVEGVDWGTDTHCLHYPFKESELWAALEKVEAEANEIWESTHGCDECGEPDEYNGGHIHINPECPSCKGDGVIF